MKFKVFHNGKQPNEWLSALVWTLSINGTKHGGDFTSPAAARRQARRWLDKRAPRLRWFENREESSGKRFWEAVV